MKGSADLPLLYGRLKSVLFQLETLLLQLYNIIFLGVPKYILNFPGLSSSKIFRSSNQFSSNSNSNRQRKGEMEKSFLPYKIILKDKVTRWEIPLLGRTSSGTAGRLWRAVVVVIHHHPRTRNNLVKESRRNLFTYRSKKKQDSKVHIRLCIATLFMTSDFVYFLLPNLQRACNFAATIL